MEHHRPYRHNAINVCIFDNYVNNFIWVSVFVALAAPMVSVKYCCMHHKAERFPLPVQWGALLSIDHIFLTMFSALRVLYMH